jgi:RsmE family RNA methyltransferase
LLQPEQLEEQLILGLEQGCDTVLPLVHRCRRFRPFVEDDLPGICAATTNLVAHPGTGVSFPHRAQIPATLAIGPEGGFLPYEINKLGEAGFTPAHLGSRILSVETAVSVLLSRYIS